MAAVSFFLATSRTGKLLTRDEVGSLVMELLHEKHVFLPAAIFVGQARNVVHEEDLDTAAKEAALFDTDRYIIPNSPYLMFSLAEDLAQSNAEPLEILWYYGNDENAFMEALRRIPLREKDICICFPALSDDLEKWGWDNGATLFILTQPFPLDFTQPIGPGVFPLIYYPVADFFTLCSYILGGFSDTANNPLTPILQRSFGPDLEMEETANIKSV